MVRLFDTPYHAIWNLRHPEDIIWKSAQNYLLAWGEDSIKPLMNALWYPEQYVANHDRRDTARTELMYDLRRKEDSVSFHKRNRISAILVKLGSATVPYLVSTLFHAEEYFLREWVANILRKIRDSRATIPLLVAMLEERNTQTYRKADTPATVYLSLRPPLPFQWSWSTVQYYDFGDMLDVFDSIARIRYEDIQNYSQEYLVSILPSSMLPPEREQQFGQIIEDAFLNKVSIKDMKTHIENCLILNEKLRPWYVLAVMHHNKFDLEDALTNHHSD